MTTARTPASVTSPTVPATSFRRTPSARWAMSSTTWNSTTSVRRYRYSVAKSTRTKDVPDHDGVQPTRRRTWEVRVVFVGRRQVRQRAGQAARLEDVVGRGRVRCTLAVSRATDFREIPRACDNFSDKTHAIAASTTPCPPSSLRWLSRSGTSRPRPQTVVSISPTISSATWCTGEGLRC